VVSPDDLSSILYTSGTTGTSKGCMISHGYYTWIPEAVRRAGWSGEQDIIFGANPLFHMSGQNFLVANALTCGGEAVVEPVFHASTFMRRARETGATVINAMGAMVAMVLAQLPSPDDRDHNIRQATCVPTTPETWERFFSRFGIRINSEIFGQTEFWPVTIRPAGSKLIPGGAGQLMSHVELKIVDDDDREAPIGQIGEIVLRPKQPRVMFSGYWNNPQATVEAFRNLWHHTGDFGRLDEMGTLYFADRKKDSMRRRGENVSSMELEEAILKYEPVGAVAAHAVPSELGEDEIKTCIVPKEGATIEPGPLFEFFRANLPYYAIPRYVELMAELPRNPVNRVQKFVLRERGVTPETWDMEALGLVVERSQRRA
jgi:crotonobetaine/carnitine-CoA ligase